MSEQKSMKFKYEIDAKKSAKHKGGFGKRLMCLYKFN